MAVAGLKGRKIALFGANSATVALIKFLVRRGAVVRLIDTRPVEVIREGFAEHIDFDRIELACGPVEPTAFTEIEMVVVPAGMPLDARVLEHVRTLGIPVVSELEFVFQHTQTPMIAIAGTNGKTTTALLLTAILEKSGKSVFSNALRPLSESLIQTKPLDFIVAACSSFQLDGISSFKPAMVLLLNLTEDHLNHYPNFETYVAANREVLRNADKSTRIILNASDPHLIALAPALAGQTQVFAQQPLPEDFEGAWATRTHMVIRNQAGKDAINFILNQLRLRGSHNKENLMAASLAALQLGASAEDITHVIENFRGPAHRVEFVKRVNSVAFYNDASGANVGALLRTLQAFQEPIILISGGRDKNADYTPLIPHIRQRVKNLILVGEAKEKMNRAIGDYTETFLVGTLEEAVLLAYQKSRSGDVILMSPGCDPTDVFSSHEEKGEHFKKLVNMISIPRRPNVF